MVLVLLSVLSVRAQHTPEQIQTIFEKEFSGYLEKYDSEDAADSVLAALDRYIAVSEASYRKRPTPEIAAEIAIWHNAKGTLLGNYLAENHYRISERTPLQTTSESDWKLWDELTFRKVILNEFWTSLAHQTELCSIQPDKYASLFEMPDEKDCYSSLYDILAYHFAKQLQDLFFYDVSSQFNHSQFFEEKITLPKEADSLSPQYQFLKIMDEVASVHANDVNPISRNYNRIVRLTCLYEHCSFADKDSLYVAALQKIVPEKNQKGIVSQLVYCKLGEFYHERGTGDNAKDDDFLTAIEWYEMAIAAEPKTECAETCEGNRDEIKERDYDFSSHQQNTASDVLLQIRSKDCDSLYLAVVKCPKQRDRFPYSVIKKQTISIKNSHRFRYDATLASFMSLEPGDYAILLDEDPIPNSITKDYYRRVKSEMIHVTRLAMRYLESEDDVKVWITDFKSGKPLPNVSVRLADRQNATISEKMMTDKDGFALFRLQKYRDYWKQLSNRSYCSLELSANQGNDMTSDYISIYSDGFAEIENVSANIMTDRAIYRPGQIVEWKAILLKRVSNNEELLPNTKVNVAFYDDNGIRFAQDSSVTNEFGSVTGEIVLPSSMALGHFSIDVKCQGKRAGSKDLRVEEYKRPTFEVTMKQPDGSYKLGSDITVECAATAYAGYPVQGAKVSYNVERTTYFPFRFYGWWRFPRPTQSEKQIVSGECVTDSEGKFQVTFKAEKENEIAQSLPVYQYTITAVVTDVSGETHESSSSVRVSERMLQLEVELPDCIEVGFTENRFPIRVNNLSGVPQTAEVDFSIVQLCMPEHYRFTPPYSCAGADEQFGQLFPYYDFKGDNQPYSWREKETVYSSHVTASATSTFSIANLSKLPSGAYKLMLATTDAFGQKVDEEFFFYVSQNENEFSVYSPLRVSANKESLYEGDTVTFNIGSYLEDQQVFIRISNNDKILEQKWIRLNKSNYVYRHPIQKGEAGSMTCCAYVVREGQCFEKSKTVSISDKRNQIEFEFVTFRDKLQPGDRETVKIRMKDALGGNLSETELLALMYDASLDAFAPLKLNSIFYYPTPKLSRIRCNYEIRDEDYSPFLAYDYFHSFFEFYTIDLPTWENLSFYGSPRLYKGMVCAGRSIDGAEEMDFLAENAVVLDADIEKCAVLDAEPVLVKPGMSTEKQDVLLRSNFEETAFFYPFLTTNNGEIEFEYTIPESLTRWKMLGFAHTLAKQQGTFEKFVTTQKPLMVVPNVPRFVYEGDQVDFSAKVVNQSGKKLSCSVELQLLNAATSDIISTENQDVVVADSATVAVRFPISVPNGLVGLTYRIVVRASDGSVSFSDGETNDLPVLSRRQLVMETLPLFITKKGTKTFSFNDLPSSKENLVSCKLQFTPDARWNALLALPYLMEYPYDCNEQLFSKLYANSISSFIAKKNPNFLPLLQNTLKNQPEMMRSKLAQNADLKQIILEETPWIADAMNEDDAIQNVTCLFDANDLEEQQKSIVNKLTHNQNNDGGWSWFSGSGDRESSRYITQHLLIGAGRLMDKGICQPDNNFFSDNMLKKAINFIDKDVEQDFLLMKKENPKMLNESKLGTSELHYLYARSFYLKKYPARTEAYAFYKKQLVDDAKKLSNVYMKTMAALTLWQSNEKGDRDLAKSMMLDIKQLAIHSEEMGMYWKKEGVGFYWYEAPVERQALLIEAFQTILQDEASVKEMKVWLLQQKRTQHWETTRSTVEACHALLTEMDLQQPDTSCHVTVQLGNETVDFVDTLQVPFKKDLSSSMQSSKDEKVVLARDKDGLSYGGVTVRYYKDIDEIMGTETGQPLSVVRALFRVDRDERGEVLTALSDGVALRVGDKVRVRMEIRADRDLEFVHLKDLRAAAFEPTETLSRYCWQDGLGYYQSFRDASVNFFFDWLRKGSYVFEYTLFVTQTGTFSSGYSSIQCMYAPEFSAHSAASGRIKVSL